jgi:hypothetical protein
VYLGAFNWDSHRLPLWLGKPMLSGVWRGSLSAKLSFINGDTVHIYGVKYDSLIHVYNVKHHFKEYVLCFLHP